MKKRNAARSISDTDIRIDGDRPAYNLRLRTFLMKILNDEAHDRDMSRNALIERILLEYCEGLGYPECRVTNS